MSLSHQTICKFLQRDIKTSLGFLILLAFIITNQAMAAVNNRVPVSLNSSVLSAKQKDQIDTLANFHFVSNLQEAISAVNLLPSLAPSEPRITFADAKRSLCYYRNNFFGKNIRASYTVDDLELDPPLVTNFGAYFLDLTRTGAQTLFVNCDGFTYRIPITLPNPVTGAEPDIQLPNKPPAIASFQAKLNAAPIIGAAKNSIVTLVANATDPNNDRLVYTWGSNAGAIISTNGNMANWKLPNSTGLNFAYVLVSDGKGGYREAGLTVTTDAGTVPAPAPVAAVNNPSDKVPLADHFLTFFSTKEREVYLPRDSLGADTKMGSCRYYESIKAVSGCDAQGNLINPTVNFANWKLKWGLNNGGIRAIYANKADLNRERDAHGISNAQGTAFYVCSYPRNDNLNTNVNLSNAINNKNLQFCGAVEYSPTLGVNGNRPFTKFYVFAPSGQLLQSVNLDGRGEKYLPGSCVVCHGAADDNRTSTPAYPKFSRFAENGTTSPNLKAQFIPLDLESFIFSGQPALTRAAQEPALRALNKLVLKTNPTPAIVEAINGWYPTPTSNFNGNFTPSGWVGHELLYTKVVKPYCRSCHIAMDANSAQVFNKFSEFRDLNFELSQRVCGNTNGVDRKRYSMPNALVTFDLFWKDNNAKAALLKYLTDEGEIIPSNGDGCNPPQ
jgi:hypothetical protein